MSSAPKGQHFGGAKESAKLVRAIANAVRLARLDLQRVPPSLCPNAEGTGAAEASIATVRSNLPVMHLMTARTAPKPLCGIRALRVSCCFTTEWVSWPRAVQGRCVLCPKCLRCLTPSEVEIAERVGRETREAERSA
jgi:hypothetical protein